MAAARAVLQGPAQAAGPELEESALAFGLQLPDLDNGAPAPLELKDVNEKLAAMPTAFSSNSRPTPWVRPTATAPAMVPAIVVP